MAARLDLLLTSFINMRSFLWYLLRFSGKITFLLCASKFLPPDLFVQLQSFIIAGETIVLASSSATAIFLSQETARGMKENYYWSINFIELAMALSFMFLFYNLKSIIYFINDLPLLIIPFILTSLFLNLHYRYLIISQANLVKSQKFLILYEVIPYTISALVMAWTKSFHDGVLTLVILIGISIINWNHPKYTISRYSIIYFFDFLKRMYLYSLLTLGFKTIERIAIIEKFYSDKNLAAFLFYSKFWILGTTILIGFRGAKIVSSVSQLSDWKFLKSELRYAMIIAGIIVVAILTLSVNLDLMHHLQLNSLANGIDRATFVTTGVYCVCLGLYSVVAMIAEIRCERWFMYTQTIIVMFGLMLVYYFSNSLSMYLGCVSFLLAIVSSIIAIEMRRGYE